MKKIVFGMLAVAGILMAFIPYHFKRDNANSGESITYFAKLAESEVGEATFTVENGTHQINNAVCYKAKVESKTAGMLDVVSRVRNDFSCFIDQQKVLPHKSVQNIRQGEYVRVDELNYNHKTGKVSVTSKSQKEDVVEMAIPKNVQDVVSAFYYLRSLPFEKFQPNEIHSFQIFFDQQIVEAKFKFIGKRTISTPIGTKESYLIAPVLPPNKLIKENSARVWISADPSHIPLKVYAQADNGPLLVEIKKYQKGN